MDENKKQEIEAVLAAEKAKDVTIENPFVKKEDPAAVVPVTPEKNIPKEMVGQVHQMGMQAIIENDEKVKKQILDQAGKTIGNEIKQLEEKSNKSTQDAVYNANQEACRNYGIDESVPMWQQKMMRLGSSFWFIVYWIFASFTVAPVMVFARGFKTFIKQTWLVIAIAILCYLIIAVGIPVLITYFNAITGGGI